MIDDELVIALCEPHSVDCLVLSTMSMEQVIPESTLSLREKLGYALGHVFNDLAAVRKSNLHRQLWKRSSIRFKFFHAGCLVQLFLAVF
jgi:hypothetical protein